MLEENQQHLRSNPLENHPNYIFGDPRNSQYRLHVIVNRPQEEHRVCDIIIYDQTICSKQFFIRDLVKNGSLNEHVRYLNDEGYFLLSAAELSTIHADKLKLFKAKQILSLIVFYTLILTMPIFLLFWWKHYNNWLVSIAFLMLLLINFSIIKGGIFDWKKIGRKVFQ